RFDFSTPIEQDIRVFGRWSFDPAALPSETWNIIDAKPDAYSWAHAMEDDVLYAAEIIDGNAVIRKYEEFAGWSEAAAPLEDLDPGKTALSLAVRDGKLFLLHYNADQRLVVSKYDVETGA